MRNTTKQENPHPIPLLQGAGPHGMAESGTFMPKTAPVADSASSAIAHACTPLMWFCTCAWGVGLAGWYLRSIDSFTTQLKGQDSSRTFNESKEAEGERLGSHACTPLMWFCTCTRSTVISTYV